MSRMEHKCALKEDVFLKSLKWYQRIIMISADNPLRLAYFRSDASIREEQHRHWKVNRYAIHPFSKFRVWYEMYLVVLYTSLLTTKPIDAGFLIIFPKGHMLIYRFYTMFTDLLCWINIGFNLITGVEVPRSKVIELRPLKIVKRYVYGGYFVFDVLSSIPIGLFHYTGIQPPHLNRVSGMASCFSLLKVVRIFSYVGYIRRTVGYLRFTAKGMIFIFYTVLVSVVIIHWMACMQIVIPVLVRYASGTDMRNKTWFLGGENYKSLHGKGFPVQYVHCLFKSSAYILGIRIDVYKMAAEEDYVLAMFTYFVGKILIAFIWIILAVSIINSRLMRIKFLEIINQLEEYMRRKQLPVDLRDRILQYFVFKYRRRFFKEHMIHSLLPDSLKKEATLHVCKSLVKSVSLFDKLSPVEISRIIEYLIPEIFMPNDTIIHANTPAEVMYFLSSGTVAVYTRSGKEVCHLQDGAYFGETSLIIKGQLRLVTIVALEISHVYRLTKKDLNRCLLISKRVKMRLMKSAEEKFKRITKLEEEYQKVLFEQSFRAITDNPAI